MKPILQTKKKPQLNVAFLFARLNYFFAGASAAGAGAAFLSAAGAALLSAGFTAALGSAAGLSAAIAVNEINAVITNANIFFIYDPCILKLSWYGQHKHYIQLSLQICDRCLYAVNDTQEIIKTYYIILLF